jgi:muramoyltetrapeptide carboxypeptidase
VTTSTSMPAAVVFPRALVAGDTVAVIAPSGPFDRALTWRGLGFLASRYDVRFDRGMFARKGYFAGSDERRRRELDEALRAPDIAAIIAARGGYGASRVAHDLDWSVLRDRPKWIVGFSDITVLHAEAARHGVASIHGPHMTVLGRSDAKARATYVDMLERPLAPRTFAALRTVVAGSVEGPLFGGNLTLLHACAAAGRLAVPEGAILFLEDVTELPYRLDRMLTTLARGGHLAKVRGIILGEFTSCEAQADGVTARAVLDERCAELGVPVVADFPAGHGARNEPLVFGSLARIDASGGAASLTFRSPRAG